MSKNNKQHSNGLDFGRFDFVSKVGIFGIISTVLTVASIIYLAVAGINYGIDFKGGTEVQVLFQGEVPAEKIRATMDEISQTNKLGEVNVQAMDGAHEYVIRFQGEQGITDKETNELLNTSLSSLKAKIEADYADLNPDFRRIDTVGPQVGTELKRNGILALFYSLLIILIFVAIRFDYVYSPGAVLCLFHDTLITLALYNLLGKEMNISIMAAVLTLIGFSLNDTIVIFDRIREMAGIYKGESSTFIINKAINETLGRTFITAGAVVLISMCLFIIADGIVSDIAFIIAVGVVIGVYSSIYVASPFILLAEKFQKSGSNSNQLAAT